jgi:6-phosphogluconolactonase
MSTRITVFALLAALALATACGGGSNSSQRVPVGGGSFMYVTTSAGTISAYSINPTGSLTAVSGSPYPAATNPNGIVAANASFVYAAVESSTILGYTFDSQTGTLTGIPGSPFFVGGSRNASILSFCGGRLYGMNTSAQATVSTINGDGTLGNSSGYGTVTTGASASMAVTPNCKYLYFADPDINAVSAYTITGTGFGFTTTFTSPVSAGTTPVAVATDTSGKFLYVANSGSNNVSAFSIDANSGALTPVPGSPFPAGSQPSAIAATSSYVFVTNAGDNTISAYTFNSGTGALTPVSGSPFSTGSHPAAITVANTSLNISPSGTLVFTANQGSNNISAFTVGAGGTLTPVSGSPFSAGGTPQGMAVAVGPQ